MFILVCYLQCDEISQTPITNSNGVRIPQLQHLVVRTQFSTGHFLSYVLVLFDITLKLKPQLFSVSEYKNSWCILCQVLICLETDNFQALYN